MTDPNIGRLIAKRYQLQDLIGTGAMGQVYRANDILLGGVWVALKLLSLSIPNQIIRIQERFEREAKTCAILGQKSIHIVRVMDYGVDELGTPFYVMEYLQGENLSDIIRTQKVILPRFLNLVRQISLGLQAAHEGIPVDGKLCPIIHRDIKPGNIVVVQNPNFGELLKILDFGIAKLLQGDSFQTNYYLGTLAYSSPEQMEGKELDNRSDIYSLGVVMYEMLSGKMPLQANPDSFGGWYKAHHFQQPRSFSATNPRLQLPAALENLIFKCLAKEPISRPQNIGEILQTVVSLEQRYHTTLSTPSTTDVLALNPSDNSHVIGVRKSTFTNTSKLPSWPQNKPIADIVFPHPLRTTDQKLMPALWVMLPQQEIDKRLHCTRYNQFLFLTSPHPMILWITVLHTRADNPKWLSYYLDLKTRQGQEITTLLAETGCYQLLLFARELPQRACACLQLEIAAAQLQLLQQWAQIGQNVVSTATPQVSKSLLKLELEKIKPQILMKLEGIYRYPSNSAD